jgi:hypothetical protein
VHAPEPRDYLAGAGGFLGETFDYIICSDLVNDLWDVQRVCERIAAHAKPETRVIMNFYSRVWELPRRVSEALGLVKRQLPQNWLTAEDLAQQPEPEGEDQQAGQGQAVHGVRQAVRGQDDLGRSGPPCRLRAAPG